MRRPPIELVVEMDLTEQWVLAPISMARAAAASTRAPRKEPTSRTMPIHFLARTASDVLATGQGRLPIDFDVMLPATERS